MIYVDDISQCPPNELENGNCMVRPPQQQREAAALFGPSQTTPYAQGGPQGRQGGIRELEYNQQAGPVGGPGTAWETPYNTPAWQQAALDKSRRLKRIDPTVGGEGLAKRSMDLVNALRARDADTAARNIAEFNVNPNTRQYLSDWAKASGLDFDPGKTFGGGVQSFAGQSGQNRALQAAEQLDPGLYNQVVSGGNYGYRPVQTDYLNQFERNPLDPAWDQWRMQQQWNQYRD